MEHKYGPHLTMDLVGCNPSKLKDGKFLWKFMSDLPGKMGMNKIGEPHLDLYSGPYSEWGGFSATVHIQTSHITFHFFEWGYVFGDIFSCRDFDTEKVVEMIKGELEADMHEPIFENPTDPLCIEAAEYLKDKKSTWNLYKRGLNFPPSVA